KTVATGQLLTVNSVVNDPDLPAQILTFSLGAGAPTGVNLDSSSGVFTWTPSSAQSPSTNVVSIRVADNGTPSLSATQSFTIFVTSGIHITDIRKVDATHLSITCETQSGKNYQVEYSDELTTPMVWQPLSSSQVTAAGASQVFPITIDSTPHRFYHIAQTN
ncbi:MAG TPA: putative Ig domain-containing protein, partial [Verrucomicrobiae bacterium]|nr:putative Ig domain-containing protein [Verrucomicrobiae bacterium]